MNLSKRYNTTIFGFNKDHSTGNRREVGPELIHREQL